MGFECILLGYKISTRIHCNSEVKRNLSVDTGNRCFDVSAPIVTCIFLIKVNTISQALLRIF